MQVLRSTDTLDGGNLCIVFNLVDRLVAGTLYLAVDDNGAGTADADAAADLAAGEAETTDDVGKLVFLRIAHEHALDAIDNEHFFLQNHGVSPFCVEWLPCIVLTIRGAYRLVN